MSTMISQNQHQYPPSSPAHPQVVVVSRYKFTPTTRVECFLLLLTILLMPLESHVPSIYGFSYMFFLFAISGLYVIMKRFGSIARIWNHPCFLASYVLLFLSIVLETASPNASYGETIRLAQMFIGAVVIATLCRDMRALKSCILGYILVGIWVSLYLFLTSYGALQGATATNFDEASQVRAEVFQETSLQANPNELAFFVAQGAVAALALAFMARSAFTRYSLFGITALCLIASFLPLSRGGTVIMLLACMVVTLAYVGITRGASFQRVMRIGMLILGLGVCILVWVPNAVFARFNVNPQTPEGPTEARTALYQAALVHLPEYGLTGVGAGNFWGPWGQRSQFRKGHGILGAHNCFIQITLYWGLLGLLALSSVVYRAYKCLPKKCGNNPWSLAMLGIVVSLLVFMLVMHVLSFKAFSLGLGILIGTRFWIWPAGETALWQGLPRRHAIE